MKSTRPDAIAPRSRTPLAALLVFVVAFVLLGTSSAFAITRDTVLSRAQRRIDAPVPYSQSKYYAGYRTDCSGYVSMCWQTGTSWNTRTFHNVTHRISVADLKPGDALLKKGYHIRLFYGWVDDAHTEYIAYETAYGTVAGTRIHAIADDLDYGYVPVRFDRIKSSPASRNVLRNPTFDVWARQWRGEPEHPVWWDAGASPWQPQPVHRKDVYRTQRNSLELRNPSTAPSTFSELSQSAPIVPGAHYRLSAYARSASTPVGTEMVLAYLDDLGTPISETRTTGDRWALDNTAFKLMSVAATAPPDAVAARVTFRLAGGSTTTPAGVVPGTSVILDDISLVRPQVTVSIARSRRLAYNGTTVTVSGSVGPNRAIGAPAIVYMKKPGGSWQKLATTTVYANGGSAAWRRSVKFTSKWPRGVYRFKTTIPAIPGYLGATSSTAYVRLR